MISPTCKPANRDFEPGTWANRYRLQSFGVAESARLPMGYAYDEQGNRTRLARLAERGVNVWGPERVYVADDVRLDRICPGAELIQATITGANTFIGRGARIGVSGHAVLHEQRGPETHHLQHWRGRGFLH